MQGNENILITGISGYIGSALAKALLEIGKEVHGVIRKSSDLIKLSKFGNAKLHVYDGSFDSLSNIIEKIKPGVCFHLASLFLPRHQPYDIEPLINDNITFGTKLLESLRRLNKKVIFINAGTCWQNYNGEEYNPVALYAATKQAFQDILKFYSETSSIGALTLKLFDTFGPMDSRPKIINLLKEASLKGGKIRMSPGDQLIDLTYIDDVIAAFIQAEKVATVGSECFQVFSVNSGKTITLRELVRVYQEVTNKRLDVEWGALAYRDREMFHLWRVAPKLPGWEAKVSIREGLRKIEEADFNRE